MNHEAREPGLLIINADDWGGWTGATDAALACHRKGRITSVTAMMFMADSERAARLAKVEGMTAGLHLNLNQNFDGSVPTSINENHQRLVGFLKRNKYAQLVYNPALKRNFRADYEAQLTEFHRLYGTEPSHIDGHQHKHLCANMLIDGVISSGRKVRRNFSFWPGEKSAFNRLYRSLVDRWLARKYQVTDFFFSLEQCLQYRRIDRVIDLAKTKNVELMTHPEKTPEFNWLMSDESAALLRDLHTGSYTQLAR